MSRFRKFGTVRTAAGAAALACVFAFAPQPARAQLSDPMQSVGVRPDLLKDVGIDQKLNQRSEEHTSELQSP